MLNKNKLSHQFGREQTAHLQQFRNMRSILLDTIRELILNAQIKSEVSSAYSDQMVKCLGLCEDLISDCKNSLQYSKYDLSIVYGTYVTSRPMCEIGEPTLEKYLDKLEASLLDFIENQKAFQDIEHINAAKEILNEFFNQNIELIHLAIRMLKLITEKCKKCYSQLKNLKESSKVYRQPKYHLIDKVSDHMEDMVNNICESLQHKTEECSINTGRSENSDTTRETGGRIRSTISRKIIKEMESNKHDKRISSDLSIGNKEKLTSFNPSRVSSKGSKGQTFLLKGAATYIIDAFIAQKIAPNSNIRSEAYLNGNKLNEDGVNDVWISLCELHNQILLEPKKYRLEVVREILTKFYITSLQLALQKECERLKSRSRNSIKRAYESVGSLLRPSTPAPKAYLMHLNLYRLQLTKLKSAKKMFNAPQLYKMIMNQELPRSQSDHDLFNKYVSDREHYNILLMLQNNESQGEVLLQVLEKNFEEISKLIDRKKRFRNIFQRLINDKQQQSYINLKRDSIPVKVRERTTIDEEFLKMERAKWVKYFANQKLTATERKLAQIRVEKLQSLAGKQKAERRQKILQKRKKTRSMKAIIALYKAPRLTNRLRRAMDQMAANKLIDLSASSQACQLNEMKTVKNEEHPLADGLMESVSWTSCCSECKRMNDTLHETALDRFHRTHEEIKATANYCDYYPS